MTVRLNYKFLHHLRRCTNNSIILYSKDSGVHGTNPTGLTCPDYEVWA